MFKINFLLLLLFIYSVIGQTRPGFTVDKKDNYTNYTCCGIYSTGSISFIPEDVTNISLNSNGSCEYVIVPQAEKYCGVVVRCGMQNEPLIWSSENKTHLVNMTCPSPTTSPVPTASKVSTPTGLTATHISTSAVPYSTLVPTSTGSPSSFYTSFLSTVSSSPSKLNDVYTGIISACAIIVVTVVFAVVTTTAACLCCRRKTKLENIAEHLEAGEAPTYLKTLNEAFITPEQPGKGEKRISAEELVVVPFEKSVRNERRSSSSRGARVDLLDDLEKPQSDAAMLCGVVENEENMIGTIKTYSAASLSSTLQVEEPVSVSVDDHQTQASTQEIEANMRSTTVSLQPPRPYFLKQSSYCPSVDNSAGHTTDSFTDRGQVTDHQEN